MGELEVQKVKIGNIEFRKPWVRYVDVPLEEEIYWAIRKSITQDIIKDLNAMIEEKNG